MVSAGKWHVSVIQTQMVNHYKFRFSHINICKHIFYINFPVNLGGDDDEVEADDENGEDDVVAICTDSTLRFKFNLDGNNVSRNCSWVRKNATKKRCRI